MNTNDVILPNSTVSSGGSFDIFEYLGMLWNNILVIILAGLVCGFVAFGYTYLFKTAEYSSSVLVYINKSNVTIGGTDITLSSGESVSDTYTTILKSRTTLEEIAETAEVDYSWESLSGMITIEGGSSGSFMNITVTCGSPTECEKIANTIAEVLPNRVADIVDGSTLRVVDYAVVPSSRTTTDLTESFLIGFGIGAGLVCVIILIKMLIDSRHAPVISSASTLTDEYSQYPLLGIIGDLTLSEKKYTNGVYGYGKYSDYYKTAAPSKSKESSAPKEEDTENGTEKENKQSNSKTGKSRKVRKEEKLICDNISYAAKEGYKRVRTNMRFCIDSALPCPVIGVTSTQPSDGKTVTAINIAYTFAQLPDKKVLLIDCDMRRPTSHLRLGFSPVPGLSNILSNVEGEKDGEVLHTYLPNDHSASFDFLPAGTIPPNPSELLADRRFKELIDRLKQDYDFIVLDLPPVGAVSDAQVASSVTDGMVLVIHESYCTKPLLDECLAQLKLANAHLLGFLLNGSIESTKAAYKYKKYSRSSYYQ